jgi:hypothetical protein
MFRADAHIAVIDHDAIFVLRRGSDAGEDALARLGPISEMRARIDCQAVQLPEDVRSRSDR